MGVEERANYRRGRVRESMCGVMDLTQAQPLLPPIKEERLLPTNSVHYTQEGWVSENGICRKLGFWICRSPEATHKARGQQMGGCQPLDKTPFSSTRGGDNVIVRTAPCLKRVSSCDKARVMIYPESADPSEVNRRRL